MFKKLLFVLTIVVSCSDNNVKQVDKQHHVTISLPDVTVNQTVDIIPRAKLLEPLFKTMHTENEERLPFDEPLHEYGWQLDGKLRPRWETAYLHGKSRFGFNGDWYATITKGSAPFVPQVCADFIVDTIDRTAGTWYAASLRHPQHTIGRFNMRKSMSDMSLDPRRAPDLIEFFHKNPEWFSTIYDGEKNGGPPVGSNASLLSWLKDHDVQVGDIMFIRGKAPWDHGREEHWHSLIVASLTNDGYVSTVFGNPAYPVERHIDVEMKRAPKRHVVNITRLTDNFLKKING